MAEQHTLYTLFLPTPSRGVVPGGAWGAMAHPDFGRSVNPISTGGRDYAHIPYSREQKHVSISDTPMLLIEINSISNMGCQK